MSAEDLPLPDGADHAEQRGADQPRDHLRHQSLSPEEERGVFALE